MGEEAIACTSGYLYICDPDAGCKPLGTVTNTDVTSSDSQGIPEYALSINKQDSTFEFEAKVQKDLCLKLLGVYDAIVNLCPNKRVAHLALNGRTHKIRKKNLHRVIKILEKEN